MRPKDEPKYQNNSKDILFMYSLMNDYKSKDLKTILLYLLFMIVGKDFLTKLKSFGLNSYEGKLWVALLSRGVSTAGELSDIANVPRSRTYDVLESLEKKGFIIVKIGKPIKYLAVEPTEVVSRVQKTIQKESETQIKLIDELKGSEILNELSSLHNQGIEMVDPVDYSGSFKGRDSVYDHIDAMCKAAETSITIMTTEGDFVRKVERLKRTFEKAAQRGVTIRIAATLKKVSESDELVKTASSFAEVKNVSKIESRFVVVDGKEVLFMLQNDDTVHPSYDVGVWVNTPFFAGALEQLFELAWKEMTVVSKQ